MRNRQDRALFQVRAGDGILHEVAFAGSEYKVSKRLKAEGIVRNGVYVAHDSVGCARCIGRGSIVSRLSARWKATSSRIKIFLF